MKHRHGPIAQRSLTPAAGSRKLIMFTAALACAASTLAAAPAARAAPHPSGMRLTAGTTSSALLEAVSADSATDAWAVGEYADGAAAESLILRWNGTNWKKAPSPSPAPGGTAVITLNAVSVDSAADAWAVGQYYTGIEYRTLTLHWNGTKWTKVSSPSPSPSPSPGGSTGDAELYGVTALSPTDAWATGDYDTSSGVKDSVILHWNGTKWVKVPSPNPGGTSGGGTHLYGAVSADSPSDAWAVGQDDDSTTLILRWNGTKWKNVPSPTPDGASALEGVSAVSPADAWADGPSNGSSEPFVLRWNGTSWTQATTPTVGGPADLDALNADSSADAWAVGSYGNGTGLGQGSLALHWNGTDWTQVASPNPGGTGTGDYTLLNGASAVSPTDAWAVGDYGTYNGVFHTLILQWNGINWTRVTAPSP